jgi:hypothetical protein
MLEELMRSFGLSLDSLPVLLQDFFNAQEQAQGGKIIVSIRNSEQEGKKQALFTIFLKKGENISPLLKNLTLTHLLSLLKQKTKEAELTLAQKLAVEALFMLNAEVKIQKFYDEQEKKANCSIKMLLQNNEEGNLIAEIYHEKALQEKILLANVFGEKITNFLVNGF